MSAGLSDGPPLAVDRQRLTEPLTVHVNDCDELVVVAGGVATHLVDDRDYGAAAGDVWVVRAGQRHGFEAVRDLDLYTVAYAAQRPMIRTERLWEVEGFGPLFVFDPRSGGQPALANRLRLGAPDLRLARDLLDELGAELEARREGYRAMVEGLLLQLVTLLARAWQAPAGGPSEKQRRLAPAVAEMDRRYLEDLEIGELAARAGVCQRHFRRLFREVYGVTPLNYLLALRLRRACRLLTVSDASITAIALDCGFADGNYFARKFRQMMRLSPRQYRQGWGRGGR